MPDRPASPKDPAYRAVGRFIVEFSRVIDAMQQGVAGVVGLGVGQAPLSEDYLAAMNSGVQALRVAAAQVTSASDLTNMFFGVCTRVVELTDEERQVRDKLRKRVIELIERRNDIAHGIWSVGLSEGDQTSWRRTLLMRDKASRDGVKIGNLWLTADELEALADEAIEVADLVMMFSFACNRLNDSFRVSDMLEIADGQVRLKTLEAIVERQAALKATQESATETAGPNIN